MATKTRTVLHFLFGWIPVIGGWFSIEDKSLPPPPKDFPRTKVAIILAGVGECSAAYFLQELCGESVELHVFSDGPVKGRTGVVEIDGHTYESGASVAHSSNKYLVDFTKKFWACLIIKIFVDSTNLETILAKTRVQLKQRRNQTII